MSIGPNVKPPNVPHVHKALKDMDIYVIVPIDYAAEITELNLELKDINKRTSKLSEQLSNPDFVNRAPAHIVDKVRDDLLETQKLHLKTLDSYYRLKKQCQ